MRVPAKHDILLLDSTTGINELPLAGPVAGAVQTRTGTASTNAIAALIALDLSQAAGAAAGIRSLGNRRLRCFHAVIVLDVCCRKD